jgi:hypothetical protein
MLYWFWMLTIGMTFFACSISATVTSDNPTCRIFPASCAAFSVTLAGAALYYESLSIFIYTGLFFLTTHLFVVLYEEPTLRRTFGDEWSEWVSDIEGKAARVAASECGQRVSFNYEAYFRRVRRWVPKRS